MNKEAILSRQILTYMLSLTFIIIVIAILGSWLFYSFLIDYLPGGGLAANEDEMTLLDWTGHGSRLPQPSAWPFHSSLPLNSHQEY